ncbi:MAG: response regulator [Verrucomicrobiae bacterium]|nr:response regulator [Verrucomicrobiae bacterium]
MPDVLLIEDDKIYSGLCKRRLEAEGWTVRVAGDSTSALVEALRAVPDIVVLDLIIPGGMDGGDLLRYMRRYPQLETLPAVILTNDNSASRMQKTWDAKAARILFKSVTRIQVLGEILEDVLAHPEKSINNPDQPPSSSPGEMSPEIRRRLFLSKNSELLDHARHALNVFMQDTTSTPALFEFYRIIHAMTAKSNKAGLANASVMLETIESLLHEISEAQPSPFKAQFRIVNDTFETIPFILEHTPLAEPEPEVFAQVLLIDENSVSRKVILHSLSQAGIVPDIAEDTASAFEKLSTAAYDLVILDLSPGLHDQEDITERIRALPAHAHTPLIQLVGRGLTVGMPDRKAEDGDTAMIVRPFWSTEIVAQSLRQIFLHQLARIPPHPLAA